MTLSEATYLLWLYCGNMPENATEAVENIRRNTGLYLSAGKQYSGNENDFFRMNIACPRSVLQDGQERLKKGIQMYLNA